MNGINPIDHRQGNLDMFIIFAIKRTMEVYGKPEFITWATRWISGEDRSASSALEVEESAAISFQRANTLSSEWNAAKAAWEITWAARLSSMGDRHRVRATDAANRAVTYAKEALLTRGPHDYSDNQPINDWGGYGR